ncbi:hypothetical protein [Kribbella sp.]|uniref:hypothetical protein n=1 Tax=Kribbella sp. TaxID=1871183 RepID=UPI002D618794|nr:hypothetical protein [Kribbella sp.]HZX09100.1 hypothetical protein [Kribbella sp.]
MIDRYFGTRSGPVIRQQTFGSDCQQVQLAVGVAPVEDDFEGVRVCVVATDQLPEFSRRRVLQL